MTRSCARRSFAAETIFMALVICCVFLTERMRRRKSMRLGMAQLLLTETAFQFADSGSQVGLQSVIENLLLADRCQNRRLGIFEELVELGFEGAAIFDGDIVEQALGG